MDALPPSDSMLGAMAQIERGDAEGAGQRGCEQDGELGLVDQVFVGERQAGYEDGDGESDAFERSDSRERRPTQTCLWMKV